MTFTTTRRFALSRAPAEITVDHGVPIPPKMNGFARGKRGSKYPFASMKPGDSFFVASNKESGRVSILSCGHSHSPKAKFATRKVTENKVKGFRIWRTV